MTTFETLGLSPAILRSVTKLGFDAPTPIQAQAIPLVLEGRDIMGLAQTGTGKTAAFGLPLVHHLAKYDVAPDPKSVRALILAPTRELVNQIADNLRSYVRGTPLKINLVVGGASINNQIRFLGRGSDILVATPGRLLDLIDRRAVFLDKAKYLVLDEADQMLDLGFIHDLRKIAGLVGKPRQTLLFSATMNKQMSEISATYLTDPIRIEVASPGKTADNISQSVHFIDQSEKGDFLKNLLLEDPKSLSLVFSRTKHGAEKLMKKLVASGIEAQSIHGNKSQNQRERAIKAFRKGDVRVLVATDVAARGIDIPGVSHVYNFDLPNVPESYVHRIGRTARAGKNGEAVAFCAPDEFGYLLDIQKLTGLEIPVASGKVPTRVIPGAGRQQKRRSNGGGGGQGRGPRRGAEASAKNGPSGNKPPHKRRRSSKPGNRPQAAAS